MKALNSFRINGLAAMLAALALLLPCAAAVAADAGRFQFVVGDIKVVSATGEQRVPAKGDAFKAGDTIITGPSGSAQIRMSDGGMVAVRPDTQLKLDQYVFNGREDGNERKIVSLIKGGFRVITGLIGNRNKDNYKVLTPSATIGIRGTDHEPVVIPPGAAGGFAAGTYDRVYRGATIIETDKGKLIVNPNQVGFAPGKGAAPVLLPKVPEFYETRPLRPEAARDPKGDTGAEGDESRSTGERTLPSTRSSATLKDAELKERSTLLRSPLDTATTKETGDTTTLKTDVLRKDSTLTTPLDTRTTTTLKDSTLKESTLSAPTSLKTDALTTPITVPTTTPKTTEVLSSPVAPTTTIKTPTTTTVTTPLTTTKPLTTTTTTTTTPKTEVLKSPTTTTIRSITTKP